MDDRPSSAPDKRWPINAVSFAAVCIFLSIYVGVGIVTSSRGLLVEDLRRQWPGEVVALWLFTWLVMHFGRIWTGQFRIRGTIAKLVVWVPILLGVVLFCFDASGELTERAAGQPTSVATTVFSCLVLLTSLLLGVCAAVVLRAVDWLIERMNPGVCSHCGYSLIGLAESRCPECGTRFSSPVGSNADTEAVGQKDNLGSANSPEDDFDC
jgi:hypothetical protein